jgi:UDP-N-acetylmuramyl tripeptide synthase
MGASSNSACSFATGTADRFVAGGIGHPAAANAGRRRAGRSLRSMAAVRAARMTSALCRTSGLGQGTALGGWIATRLDPNVLRHMCADRPVVLVSGTNGKTTTTTMLAAAVAARFGSVLHNASGSNMPQGLVSALVAGAPQVPAVLEVDELYLATVAEAARPAVLVLLNLTRDQLHRTQETARVARSFTRAVREHPTAVVVANADDPAVVAAVAAVRSARVQWVSTGWDWTGDSLACPACGDRLRRRTASWWCPCGLRRPEPDWVLDHGILDGPPGVRTPLRTALPGGVNRANGALAVAAATAMGCPPWQSAAAVCAIREVSGRYGVREIAGVHARLLLAKNPAGWAATVDVLHPGRPVLLVLNARGPDGRDTSWLWDVPVEHLGARRVLVSGERAADLATRLCYAEIATEVFADPLRALAAAGGHVDVVANYTAFCELRRVGR